jgi:hypothetical protein
MTTLWRTLTPLLRLPTVAMTVIVTVTVSLRRYDSVTVECASVAAKDARARLRHQMAEP